MTTLIQAAEQALEALNFALHVGFDESSERQIKKGDKASTQHRNAITALRQAIALEKMAENERELGIQMKADEPVARVVGYYAGRCVIEPLDRAMVMPDNMALYAHPQPKREWVGLTDEEIDTWNIVGHESLREFVRAIEAKLKEKNHG